MRKILVCSFAAIVLIVMNLQIISKERTLKEGKTLLLRLAPVDPRSLMQGDYMVLRYQLAREVDKDKLEESGQLVLSLDENGVGEFIRFYEGGELEENEQLLFYRNRGGLRLGAESFFFQEGKADVYQGAVYGMLKVTKSGESILSGLCDKDFQKL